MPSEPSRVANRHEPDHGTTHTVHIAHVAFGGNLGDVKESFIQARTELQAAAEVELLTSSRLYRTPPVGPAGQPDYLNAAVAIRTSLEPLQLLQLLQQIEERHGRVRGERWGARTLDLDLIAYDQLCMRSERLTIPHSMAAERMFVLRPLCDIDSKWQHPVLKMTAEQLMNRLIASGEPPLSEGEVW